MNRRNRIKKLNGQLNSLELTNYNVNEMRY